MTNPVSRILITGAAGRIGSGLRRLLPRHYQLVRLMDIRPMTELAAHEEAVVGDFTDPALAARALDGIEGLVHLAAEPSERDLAAIDRLNLTGVRRLFGLAHQAGVRRLVFGSSHHAVGGYPIAEPVPVELPPRPDSIYGASKAFGEALARFYVDLHGLEAVCLRIGSYQPEPQNARQLITWISPRDMAHLTDRALRVPGIGFCITYGYSGNRANPTHDPAWARLGYTPADDAEPHRARVAAIEPEGLTGILGGGRIHLAR